MTETNPFEGRPLYGTGDLAVFLGGSEASFTGLLLILLQKADPGNVARIRKGFPEVVQAWRMWNSMSPCPTPQQLRRALQGQDAEMQAEGLAAGDPGPDRYGHDTCDVTPCPYCA